MAKRFQFDEFGSGGKGSGKTPLCLACEDLLVDALDESLEEADRAWFEGHVSTCANCSEMLADAQRGAAWLEMLRTPRPEPSARLMERILAQTSGAGTTAGQAGRGEIAQQPQMVPAMAPAVLPLGVAGNILEFRPQGGKVPAWTQWRSRGGMFEPRLAMTAAMAFFSIALTLNLTGVQLNRLHAKDLSPSGLKRTYYTANAEAARYYNNLRVVRVLESRVDDLREAVADRADAPKAEPRQQPEAQPQTQPATDHEAPKNEPEQKKKPEPGVSRQAAPMAKPGLLRARKELPGDGRMAARWSKMRGAGGLA